MVVLLAAVQLGVVALLSLIANSLTTEGAWATFAPDLTVGILTTLGLGALLWVFTHRLERGAEDRALMVSRRREAESGWNALRPRVAIVLWHGSVTRAVMSSTELGTTPRRLVEMTADKPLESWFEVLDDSLIALLRRVVAESETAYIQGERLDSVLESVLVPLHPAAWRNLAMLLRTQAQGVSRADVLPYLPFVPTLIDWSICLTIARSSPELQDAWLAYKRTLERLQDAVTNAHREFAPYLLSR